MNEELAKQLLKQMQAQTAVLSIIAEELSKIAQAAAPASPNFKRPLADYPGFDWQSIDATVEAGDSRGNVTRVRWGGQIWTRRSGSGKFGNAIWFSRAVGRDEEGGTQYARLITFKDYSEPEPLAFEPAQGQPDQPPRRDNRPMPQAQAVAAAAAPRESRPDEPSARESFYALAGQAIKAGQVGADKVNEIVRSVNQHGYDWGLGQLQAQMAA